MDTIIAQATPAGRGGVSIVRVSGNKVKEIIQNILKTNLSPRHATYLAFYANEEIVDSGIAIYFPHPHSFTGEDVLEFHTHGGPVIVDMLMQHLLTLNTRLARPGEFSERAFLNGKIDLAQAEAVSDLINASSVAAARSATRSLQGEFSREIHQINEKLIQLRMYIEAAIDFTDEEIDFLSSEKMNTNLQIICNDLTSLQYKAKQGSLLREGINAVIMGEPNGGKSSLLNQLSGKEIAIVTDIPGTTRDVLRETILIDGMPMHLIDTAGLRESPDLVEQEGIRRAYQEMQQADIILYVHDASKTKINLTSLPNTQNPILIIHNKIDITKETPFVQQDEKFIHIKLSAKTGAGIDLLKSEIKKLAGFQSETQGIYLARRRHLDALQKAHEYVQSSLEQLRLKQGELAAEDLRCAQQCMNEITGEFTADDLLGRIFASFCIGK